MSLVDQNLENFRRWSTVPWNWVRIGVSFDSSSFSLFLEPLCSNCSHKYDAHAELAGASPEMTWRGPCPRRSSISAAAHSWPGLYSLSLTQPSSRLAFWNVADAHTTASLLSHSLSSPARPCRRLRNRGSRHLSWIAVLQAGPTVSCHPVMLHS